MRGDGLYHGDCLEVLANVPAETVALVMTSPPYAMRRRHVYGGIPADQYVAWILPRLNACYRILKPTGSLVLNIKEHVENGERHPYVLSLILAMRQHGWRWTEEYIWHKKNSVPGYWPNRFRDAWERLLHFTKAKRFIMNQDAVKVPIGAWSRSRLKSLGARDYTRQLSRTQSGFSRSMAYWVGKQTVAPTNVLHLATECGYRGYSAVFPEALPAWFIRLLSQPGDLIVDPFCGAGTTCVAAKRLGRRYLGIDTQEKAWRLAREAVARVSVDKG